jgi:hypothetical protein
MTMKGLWKITLFAIGLIILILLWFFVIGLSSNQPGYFFNKSHNAVWLGHEWVGEKKTDQEIQELVNTLKQYGIDTVFVHAGPIKEDGTIDPQVYKYAIDFVEKSKKIDKDIQYQAWLGQIRNKIDLSNADVRHNIAKQCMILAQFVGFDGMHFDIEPVWDGDTDFIELLKESREILPEDKVISVALAEFIPQSFIWLTEHIHSFENYNSELNYENVAQYADQIVVMAYDTSMKSGWLYRWLVKEQTIWLTDLLEGTEVFIGIPSYEDEKESFDPEVENIENALKGVIKGLNNFRSDEDNFAGVAIYSYWEMDDAEWATYKDLWME